MFFLCDLCFLIHCRELYEGIGIDLRPNLRRFRLGYTASLQIEFEHFQIHEFLPTSEMFLLPITEQKLDQFMQKHSFLAYLDRADQSLLAGAKENGGIILSDDGEIILEAKAMHLTSMMLPQLGLRFVKDNLMSKHDWMKAWKFWETNHRFTNKDLKLWKNEWQKIT